jgi:hypothetical protein
MKKLINFLIHNNGANLFHVNSGPEEGPGEGRREKVKRSICKLVDVSDLYRQSTVRGLASVAPALEKKERV